MSEKYVVCWEAKLTGYIVMYKHVRHNAIFCGDSLYNTRKEAEAGMVCHDLYGESGYTHFVGCVTYTEPIDEAKK